MKQPLSARVSVKVLSKAKQRAELENVSLSAIVEFALEDFLALAEVRTVFDKRPGEMSPDELKAMLTTQPVVDATEKPDWAIALEARVTELENGPKQTGRKGKRRR